MAISNMTLVKIAAVTGMATVTMGMALRFKLNNNIKATDYYKDALKTLRSHKGAVQLLGEPIKDMSIDVGNERKNFTKEDKAQYEVPVSGSKQRGILYFWASKENSIENKWNVNRIELELVKEKDRRLLIKSEKNY